MSKIKILLAEDDINMGLVLTEFLRAKGFEVMLATDGKIGIEMFRSKSFDFCILDIMMPHKDGFTLAREIRAINADIPIIFLTAKSMSEDVIKGLKIGGDDYITKPFNMEELLLRINAIWRRASDKIKKENKQDMFTIGKYTFYHNEQVLEFNGEKQKLTSKEAELLYMLCENINEPVQRSIILNKIWGDDNYFNGRSMDVYITKIRKYLKDDPSIEIINIHGSGYKLLVK